MNSALSMSKWYVLYTRPNTVKRVAEDIRSINIEYFLPTRIVTRKWSDRIKKVEEPLFLNYIFVKTSFVNRFQLSELPGVIKFVSFGGKPVWISEPEIERIRKIVNAYMPILHESYYTVGDKVKVVNGIFAGMEGTLMRNARNCRLLVKLPVLKQAISVEIEEKDIIKQQSLQAAVVAGF